MPIFRNLFFAMILFCSSMSLAQSSKPTEAEALKIVQDEIHRYSLATFEKVEMKIFAFKALPEKDRDLKAFTNELANILKRDRYFESYLTESSAVALAGQMITLSSESKSHYAIYNYLVRFLFQNRWSYMNARNYTPPSLTIDLNDSSQAKKVQLSNLTIYEVKPMKFDEIRSLLPYFNYAWSRNYTGENIPVEVALFPISDIPGTRVFITNDPVNFHILMKRLARWENYPEFFKGENLFGLYFFGLSDPHSIFLEFLNSARSEGGYDPINPSDAEEVRRLNTEKEFLTYLEPSFEARPNDILLGGSSNYAFRATFSHEIIHAQYRQNKMIPELMKKFWDENMPEEDRKGFISSLSSNYNPELIEPIRNEFMAYMLTEDAEHVYSKPVIIALILKYRPILLDFFKSYGIEIIR